MNGKTFEEFLELGRRSREESAKLRRQREAEMIDAMRRNDVAHAVSMAKKLSQVGPRFQERTLDAYACPPGDPTALHAARAIVDDPYEVGGWFFGDAGTGKTHLVAGAINAITDRGIPAVFVSVLELIDRLKASYDRKGTVKMGETDVIRWLSQIDVLVLDDLDKAEFTPWVSSRLYALINQRYENSSMHSRRSIIVTSNRSVADLGIAWSKKGIDPIIGRAIMDRLIEMSKQFVRVEGESYRERLWTA